MQNELYDMDQTIRDIKIKISKDPDPFLIDVLKRLLVIRENQQTELVNKAFKKDKTQAKGGFKGYGVP